MATHNLSARAAKNKAKKSSMFWKPEGYFQLGEGKLADTDAGQVLLRLKKASGVANALDLANWLEARLSWLKKAERWNRIPARWIYIALKKAPAYNPVWLLSGKGEELYKEEDFFLPGRECA